MKIFVYSCFNAIGLRRRYIRGELGSSYMIAYRTYFQRSNDYRDNGYSRFPIPQKIKTSNQRHVCYKIYTM